MGFSVGRTVAPQGQTNEDSYFRFSGVRERSGGTDAGATAVVPFEVGSYPWLRPPYRLRPPVSRHLPASCLGMSEGFP